VTETIFALASGAPPSAIAVVRISGPDAFGAVEALVGKLPQPRYMSLRSLRNPADGALLDRGLVVIFPRPRTATGEDLAELHLHGGRAVVDAVEAALGTLPGLRPARAGEFTWRAFENGVLDLVEVESLSDLLRAETESQRRAALAGSGLSARVESWRQRVLLLSALVEAALDQSDEDDVPADDVRARTLADELVAEMAAMLARPGSERLFDGVRVVFAGPPNAGKSTLINALAERDVAITSPIAGTTRDVIEAPVKLQGIAFVLTDTAGLRAESGDAIEEIGIARARERIAAADIVVWMADEEPDGIDADRLIRIFPRADARASPPPDRLAVSAQTGQGLGELIAALVARARAILPREDEAALTRRQRRHVAACHAALVAFQSEADELIRAEHLRDCRRSLDSLTGRAGTEEMLDALFSTFCVGK
jgi:tRNA modification GTPase